MTEPPLPERVRLLHVGPPKTGTTALQTAFAARRRQLLAHGVRYPGTGVDHGVAVAAFLEERWGWGGAGSRVPTGAHWAALRAEVVGEQRRRVLLGHEYAAKADEPTIARFDDALGPRLRAVITLRDPAAMLPSIWQESLKTGGVASFDDFLRRGLQRPGPDGADHPSRNQALLVERWARALGPHRVVVVVADRARPEGLFEAFEALLALPPGLLGRGPQGRGGNRGLTADEAAVLLEVNRAARAAGMRWDDYAALVERGAIGALLEHRVPPAAEARVALPAWAHQAVRARAEQWTERIAASGVRVVGDLAALVPGAAAEPGADDGRIARDAAATALAGLVTTAAARGRDAPSSRLAAVDPREHLVVRSVSIAGLGRVAVSRVLRRGLKASRILVQAARGR